ncbi:hypothetical protein BURKHO8Y_340001 [Burkholderia sp. 8Y]|nr:hypothetical protein BURKHO8Y_340001 [Burkholderia sp. 8Y]
MKLADKICNLRDIAASPPTDWSTERKREYFDWAKAVVAGLRGLHPALEAVTCLSSSDRFNLGERPRLLQLNNTAA